MAEIKSNYKPLNCYGSWCVTTEGDCDDNQHGHDSQCSTISKSRLTLLEEHARMPV